MHTRTKIQEPRVSKRKVHKNYTTTAFPHPLSRLTPVISTPNHTNSVMGNETRIAQCPYRSMLPRKAPSRAMPSYAALLNSVPSSAGRRLDVRYSAVNSFPYTNRPQAHNASCEYYQRQFFIRHARYAYPSSHPCVNPCCWSQPNKLHSTTIGSLDHALQTFGDDERKKERI